MAIRTHTTTETAQATVSVVVPNYNHAHYLPQRLDSILNQTYQPTEIILLDDCSTDTSRHIMEYYANLDTRIRLVFNEQNSGSTFKQWNKGIELAKSEYVWLAESDDYASPTLLAELVACLQADSQIGLAYCDSNSVDENGLPMPVPTWLPFLAELDAELWQNNFVRPGLELVRRFMSYRNIIPNASAVLLRRSTLQQVGPADGSFRIVGDWLFWVKILAVSKVAFVAKPLNYFRTHRNNVRSSTLKNGIALLEASRLLGIIRQYGEPDPHFYQLALTSLLENWFHAWIYYKVPYSYHCQVYTNLTRTEPGFQIFFMQSIGRILFRNRFSGIKIIFGDKILKILRNDKNI